MIRAALAVLLAIMTASYASGGVELVLVDGTSLTGAALGRHSDEFHLESDDGTQIVIPTQLVRHIRMTGGLQRPADTPRKSEPYAQPSTRTPTPSGQLAAFGRDPAYFQTAPISPTWRYEDVLGRETDVTQFRPARWYRPPIDPQWRYDDVLGHETDVTRFSPSDWCKPPTRFIWHPTEGWSRPGFVLGDD